MKDAYYFQHDANARHDPKLIMLRKEHGIAGIGRWWILVEILREQENYTFDIGLKHNLRALRHELEFANDDELIAFLNDLNEFSLIVNLDGIIFSPALLKRMKRLDEIRAKKQIAGQKSGESRRTKSERTDVQHRSNTVQHRSNTVEQPSPEGEHLPIYSSTNSRSELVSGLINPEMYQSTEATDKPTSTAAPHNPSPQPTKQTSLVQYCLPLAFRDVQNGIAFVPEQFLATQQVFIKITDKEIFDVKSRNYHTVKDPQTTVYIKALPS